MDNVFKAMGVRLMQRVDAKVAELVPRQAFVTRSEGSHVWVRFAHESADSPESRFPSTVAGVPAGTMGWVITLGGGKGLFVATGVPKPVSDSTGATGSITATTSGTYERPEAAITIGGLTPGSVRRCKVSVTHRYIQNVAGSGSFGYRITSDGATTYHHPGSIAPPTGASGYHTFTYSTLRTVGSDGVIAVVPAFSWSSGTILVNAGYITLEVE